MTRCANCGKSQTGGQRFCGDCGAVLDASITVTTPADAFDRDRTVEPRSPLPRPRVPADGGRYLPGVVLANRYRMVALLGRGGMGEVYRADDLTLGQRVALKFLSPDLERDTERLDALLTEVRLSLRVTHPHVCRVYDIAQADGRHFIAMEYVDGEDLSSLLRRIGRLPQDKAVEISRQLCAALQAAHDEGVLHRDLKPANVMLDGRGRAKITDFGIAGATEGISGQDARAGTPKYMAPEQMAGGPLSKQTDIYALGLVLYELFTGKPAFAGATAREDLERRRPPSNPSLHISGLDPAIERGILHCLNPDPSKRPASASELALSFSTTDPLAKAIAAGETPSPEVVAQAGGSGVLSPAVAGLSLITVLAGLVVVWVLTAQYSVIEHVRLPLSTGQLEAAAQTILTAVGDRRSPVDTISGFTWASDYDTFVMSRDLSAARWTGIGDVVPSPLSFWYRESPVPLIPFNNWSYVAADNPPMSVPGMTMVRTGPTGTLTGLEVVPPTRTNAGVEPSADPDWSLLFGLAKLNLAEFTPVDPLATPPHASDTRRAWTRGDLRVEAAALGGRPVWFDVIPAWRIERAPPSPPSARQLTLSLFESAFRVVLIAGALFLTQRHARMGRMDMRGATTFAVAFFLVQSVGSVARASVSLHALLAVWQNHLGARVLESAVMWLFYLAVEPYVRKLWPDTLIAWNRLLGGQFRDPMVGRHILFGALSGLGFSLVFLAPWLSGSWFGTPPPPLEVYNLSTLGGWRPAVGNVLSAIEAVFFYPFQVLTLLLLLRIVFRRPWLAYVVLLIVLSVVSIARAQAEPRAVFAAVMSLPAVIAIGIAVLTRVGLLAAAVAVLYSNWAVYPLTLDTGAWYFPWAVVTMVCFAALAVYGFVVSVGGQKLLRDPLES